VLSALSFALDLTEGQPMGHTLRATLLAMEIADRLGLPLSQRRDLYYAALLKDVGCSSNAARVFALFGGDEREMKAERMRVDWSNYFRAARFAMAHAAPGASWFSRAQRIAELASQGPRVAAELVRLRCDRGAGIVRTLGFGDRAAEAVRTLDEHWDGHGHPDGRAGEAITLEARILGLVQTVEVFAHRGGGAAALAVARQRAGRWFDPVLVKACEGLDGQLDGWVELDTQSLHAVVREAEPGGAALLAHRAAVDRVAEAFAGVVDAKSPFTGAHSARVARIAEALAHGLGWDAAAVAEVRRAALLHDLGKLAVPNRILDKPTALTASEWEVMRMHAFHTERILEHIEGFEGFAYAAAAHHERLDGTGYCRGLCGGEVPGMARVLAVADVYDALSAARPYRGALDPVAALAVMERDRGTAFAPEVLEVLAAGLAAGGFDGAEPVPARAA
jgi:putative nucleotidyltransferase with HDIG domain